MRRYRWLALVPAIAMLGGVPFANRVEPYVLGLPFLLFWIVLWVVLTSVIMWCILVLDRARDRAAGIVDDESAPAARTEGRP
jgi:hypothetical protein